MKNTHVKLFVVIVFCSSFLVCSSMSPGIATKSPKRIACEQGCQEGFEKCKKSAGASEAKIAACKAANAACLDKCSNY
jgi:hypothetical protein